MSMLRMVLLHDGFYQRGFTCAERALLHRVRTGGALTSHTQQRFIRTLCPNCRSCGVTEDRGNLLWVRPTYTTEPLTLKHLNVGS